MEPISTTLMFFALTILAASWVMLIFAATGSDDFTWGLFSVFLPPLAYLYGLYRWEEAGDSIKAAILGFGLLALGAIA